jgi:hypothetical protein
VYLLSRVGRDGAIGSVSGDASENGNENDCLNWSIDVGGGGGDYSNGRRGVIDCDGGDESANENVDHGIDSLKHPVADFVVQTSFCGHRDLVPHTPCMYSLIDTSHRDVVVDVSWCVVGVEK